jgi:hypothetical protein
MSKEIDDDLSPLCGHEDFPQEWKGGITMCCAAILTALNPYQKPRWPAEIAFNAMVYALVTMMAADSENCAEMLRSLQEWPWKEHVDYAGEHAAKLKANYDPIILP